MRATRKVYIHSERHYVSRTGWLRASVLGANDGLISISSLIIGVAAASASSQDIIIAGVAGLIAGAMSMAAGEYVSVSSQSDLEKADLTREQDELTKAPDIELKELADIYIDRGVDPALATEVARQMMAKDALGSHAREELGISDITTAKPIQAALASGAAFSFGAGFPLLVAFIIPQDYFIQMSSIVYIVLLAVLGAISAKLGGAKILVPTLRIVFWGIAAIVFSGVIGSLFKVSTGI